MFLYCIVINIMSVLKLDVPLIDVPRFRDMILENMRFNFDENGRMINTLKPEKHKNKIRNLKRRMRAKQAKSKEEKEKLPSSII
jgi:hypothetical protein